MHIAGIQKLTLLDYPEHTAATIFTMGCNLRCPFCHNGEIASAESRSSDEPLTSITPDDLFAFLKKRQGLLDGLCISGGEPLLQPDLAHFCQQVHHLGYSIKLDTNGCFPDRLAHLLSLQLIDYVAMDVKNQPARYAKTTGAPAVDISDISKSMRTIIAQAPAFEFRTTIVQEFHDTNDLVELAHWLVRESNSAATTHPIPWYIQNFKDSETALAGQGTLHPWRTEDMKTLLESLKEIIPTVQLRGIE